MKYLSDEHKHILKIADMLDDECDKLEAGNPIDKVFFEKSIDFIRNYADKFHHAKEENILFVELNKPEREMHCNPTSQMLEEHDIGRECVRNMEEGLNQDDKSKIIENARGYSSLIREHIYKEDDILYPMSDETLSEEEMDKMYKKFKEVDAKKDINKYLNFVK